ncbi:pPIWI-associating nuclease domain-containing protein [Chryseobacterium bernardetii]|uniref:pPIWI-associating nuclease domain-containing protein n=1 Tax=Chryseobacterium bernardetii TaxID=1241978 RepID=UPI000F50DD33|nr:hypothetical protein [Chryseobacterium bernardetii]AZB33997.1 hypothetical protein EG351_10455 [Chryseobacterium bernardetii]
MNKTSEKIKQILKSEFENELFDASLKNLEDNENKLRYHNFSYSIRELSRHFLNSLAPEERILDCSWFKVETDNGKPTRGQKIKYAIQGGLTDEILANLGFDVDELKFIIKEVKTTIDSLSKYTHVNPESFNLTENEIESNSQKVLETFEAFVETIDNYRETLKDFLDGKIEDHMIDTVIYNSYENIDSLAPHYSLEYGEVYEYHISEINDREIIVNVIGSLSVTLEYGSRSERAIGDGLDIGESFPYETQIRYKISDKFPSDEYEVESFDVDTSSWYGDDDISDEELDKLIEREE